MAKVRGRAEVRNQFVALRRAIRKLERQVDATLLSLYAEAGWERVHRPRRKKPATKNLEVQT